MELTEFIQDPCLLALGIFGLVVVLIVLRQYFMLVAVVVVAIAAMILPGGIALAVGSMMLALVALVGRIAGKRITIYAPNNSGTIIVDDSDGGD